MTGIGIGVTLPTILGELSFLIDEDFSDFFEITLDDREIEIFLLIHENSVDSDNVRIIIDFINNIPKFYAEAKEAVQLCKDSGLIRTFIDDEINNIKALHQILAVESNCKISDEMFIKGLELRGVGIKGYQEGELDLSLDLSIAPEYTDELLVVYFDEHLEFTHSTHESCNKLPSKLKHSFSMIYRD